MTTITALTDLSKLPNQSQDQAVFDANFAHLVENLPLRAQQENALAANLNSIAAGGAYALPYLFNSPAAAIGGAVGTASGGHLAFSNEATVLLIDTKSLQGVSVKPILNAIATSSSTVKGTLRIVKQSDPSTFAIYNITSYTEDAGGKYGYFAVSYVLENGLFAENGPVILHLQRTGDKGDTGVMGVLPRAKFREQRASGTSAGIAVNGANTRDLNTTEFNSIPGASLAGSSVTLPSGTYDFRGWAMRYSSGSGGGGHKAYLHNVTDNATVSFGSSGSIGTLGINDRSLVSGRFTIAAAKTFQLRHYIEATSGSGQSLGFASSSGFAEVYSEIEFLKVA